MMNPGDRVACCSSSTSCSEIVGEVAGLWRQASKIANFRNIGPRNYSHSHTSCCSTSYPRNGGSKTAYFVGASILCSRSQVWPSGFLLRTSRFGKARRVKIIKVGEKFRQVGVTHVGSVLRNLEKEDSTGEKGKSSDGGRLEDQIFNEEHGDNNKNGAVQEPWGALPESSSSSSIPQLNKAFEEIDQFRQSNSGSREDDFVGALALPDVSVAGPGVSTQSWELLSDSEDSGRKDLLEDERGEEEKNLPDDDDFEDDRRDITRIPVPRQTYIAVSKVDLVSSLLTSFPSSKDASNLLEIFACLESVLHAEHKSVLEELRMDYGLAHSNDSEDDKPSTSNTSHSEHTDEFHHHQTKKKNPLTKWWRKFIRKVVGARKRNGKNVEEDLGPDESFSGKRRRKGSSLLGNTIMEEIAVQTEREKAAERFQRQFMQLLRSAQFEGLSVSDLKLTAALNSDYLLTLPIDVDWDSAASAEALLFRRGYATERQEGLLFGAKLDYLQSVMLSKLFNGLTGPLLRAGRWCIEKWESLEEDEEGRALTERIERWLEEPLQRSANQPTKTSSIASKTSIASTDEGGPELQDDEEGLEIWKAARQAVPRYEAVLSSAGSRGILIRRILVRMGLLPPESPSIPELTLDHPDHLAREPYLRPKMLERVSMRDIWRPASKFACGGNPWKRSQVAFSIFFSRSTLQEPAFQELVLLYNQSGTDQEESGLQLHTYTKIPLPDLKVVFPSKKLSFRLIDTVRLDLATLAGLFAFLVSHKFDDLLSSPSAFALDLIASVSLIVYVARVALGYKQTANRYQLLVNKTLYEKTLASGFGVAHFLLDASEEQQFKGAILVYSLLAGGKSSSSQQRMSLKTLSNVCERYLYNNFKEQVEMPMQEIVAVLLRLGLVVEDRTKDDTFISALPDEKAIAALQQRWLALMSKQSIWSVR